MKLLCFHFRRVTIFRSTFAHYHEINTSRLRLQGGKRSATDRSCGHSSAETKGRNNDNKFGSPPLYLLKEIAEANISPIVCLLISFLHYTNERFELLMHCLCFNVPRMPDTVSCSGKMDHFLISNWNFILETSTFLQSNRFHELEIRRMHFLL